MTDSPNGKPCLLPSPNMPHLHYNLSHSESAAMVALTLDREVGVDVEHVRSVVDAASIVQRYFAPGERARWQALPDHEQRAAFFRAWTRKEAYLKARGIGLSGGLDQFEVSLVPGEATRLAPGAGTADSTPPWHVYDVSPGNGYLAACTVEGAIERASVYDWPLVPGLR
jgi:4'-phosphopantetheinyl transferase